MDTQQFLAGERQRQKRATLEADPDARIAALEARVEELTRYVSLLAGPFHTRNPHSPWPFAPLSPGVAYYSRGRSEPVGWSEGMVAGDNTHGMTFALAPR
jgi:hypothetical protein